MNLAIIRFVGRNMVASFKLNIFVNAYWYCISEVNLYTVQKFTHVYSIAYKQRVRGSNPCAPTL